MTKRLRGVLDAARRAVTEQRVRGVVELAGVGCICAAAFLYGGIILGLAATGVALIAVSNLAWRDNDDDAALTVPSSDADAEAEG